MAAVEIQGLVVRYGSTVAVDGLDLSAQSGEVLALLGPNGAGKTSTVEVLEGYRRPAAGRVRVLGLDPVAQHGALAPRIGVMLQRGGVYPGMGARQALKLFASYYDHPEDPEHLLELVGLAEVARTPWRRLSGGQQQRLGLALALVGRPEVAFLDEATSGVDPEGRLAIRAVIAALRESGVCVLLSTHELDEAERLADRIVILDHGHLVASGTLDELTALAGGTAGAMLRWSSRAGVDTASLGAALRASVWEVAPGEYATSADPSPETVAGVASWLAARQLPLEGLRTGRARLEDVYLELTREAAR